MKGKTAAEKTTVRYFKNSKHTLQERIELGKLVVQCKQEYDKECSKKHFVKGTWKQIKPKEGYASKAIRIFYNDLKDKKWSDSEFRNAKAMADRAFENLANFEAEVELSERKEKRFRKEGGGRKPQVW